jgi:DNA ligase (NAD+)
MEKEAPRTLTDFVDQEMQNFIDQLNRCTKAYDEGHPLISDQAYDDLYFKLQDLEKSWGYALPNSPTQKISYEVVNKLEKVKHNHLMLSLDKTKDWNAFVNYFSNIDDSKDVVGMLKLDGLTCSLKYNNGYLVSAETRGNGEIGEDITHNAKVIKSIPKKINYKDELIIDGEIICTYDDFKQWKDEYKNPRNFASGSIRLLDSKECASRNLTFVAWNVVKGFYESNSFIDNLNKLSDLGFLVVPWTSSLELGADSFLKERAEILGYPIDGLVGRFDDIAFGSSLGSTAHHANSAFAFKFYDETYKTELLDITYDVSRNGLMVPVAVFKPIEIEGSECSKASLYNLSVMNELSGGFERRGDILTIFKANSVIPQVSKWEHKDTLTFSQENHIYLPTQCPICGSPLVIKTSDSGVKNLYCNNPQCEGKLAQQIDHYCDRKKGLDIRNLSRMTIEKLIDLGWVNNILDLYSLKEYRSEWIKMQGFGVKSVDNILDAIENSKNCKLENFISALGIPLVGVQVAKDIVKYYPTWEEFRNAVGGSWSKLPGFGIEMERALNNFDYTEADKIAEMLSFEAPQFQNSDNIHPALNFCITGKLGQVWNTRDDLITYVESKGSKVTSTVTSKTNYLVCNQDSNSTKHQKAKQLGIPIINEIDLYKLLA